MNRMKLSASFAMKTPQVLQNLDRTTYNFQDLLVRCGILSKSSFLRMRALVICNSILDELLDSILTTIVLSNFDLCGIHILSYLSAQCAVTHYAYSVLSLKLGLTW